MSTKKEQNKRVYKVIRPFYDKHNPSNSFKVNDYVTVEDETRLKRMLEQDLLEETKEPGKNKVKTLGRTTRGSK